MMTKEYNLFIRQKHAQKIRKKEETKCDNVIKQYKNV